ncbi:MAG TPA: hypothetical protein VHB48_05445 [Chitinophagaceae bacterium]|nr:hypothetical protein [Chitinophagaceae bacterium]
MEKEGQKEEKEWNEVTAGRKKTYKSTLYNHLSANLCLPMYK